MKNEKKSVCTWNKYQLIPVSCCANATYTSSSLQNRNSHRKHREQEHIIFYRFTCINWENFGSFAITALKYWQFCTTCPTPQKNWHAVGVAVASITTFRGAHVWMLCPCSLQCLQWLVLFGYFPFLLLFLSSLVVSPSSFVHHLAALPTSSFSSLGQLVGLS